MKIYLFILSWISISLMASLIAKLKGQSGLGWFFIGMLLGPIGMIRSILIDGKKKQLLKKPDNMDKNTGYKQCPDCGEIMKMDVKECKRCHYDFSNPNLHSLIPYTFKAS